MVLLLDALSLLYRTYTARSADGEVGGLYGFTSLLSQLVQEEDPVGLALALDAPGPTVRQERSPGYKAGRPPAPEALRVQIPLLPALARAVGVPLHQVPRQEADDVLASLAARISEPVRIVTADSDLLQLIDDRVSVRFVHQKTRRHRVIDAAGFRTSHGFAPSLLPTWKAMVGDPSDNLPGVPGIGRPTARRLCGEYGDAEAILAALDAGRLRNPRVPPLLSASREGLVHQEGLARLDATLPLAEPLWSPVDRAALAARVGTPEIGPG